MIHCEEHSVPVSQPDGRSRLRLQAGAVIPVPKAVESTPRRRHAAAPATQAQLAGMWRVVVLNDPVNRMSYVVMVLRRVFGFGEELARRHMMEVHESGRSVVWAGTREQAEAHVFALHQWHLTAVIQPDEAG